MKKTPKDSKAARKNGGQGQAAGQSAIPRKAAGQKPKC